MSSTHIATAITDANRFLPHLLIADEVRSATMTATNSSSTSVAVQTMTTYSRWTPTAGATITATFSGAKSIDYAAIYVTASAGTYTLEWYNGSAWAAIGSALSSTGAGCVAWVFESVSASALRIVCSSTPSIAVFKAGARTQIPVGIGVGYEPSLFNPSEKRYRPYSRNVGRVAAHRGEPQVRHDRPGLGRHELASTPAADADGWRVPGVEPEGFPGSCRLWRYHWRPVCGILANRRHAYFAED